MHAEGRCEKEEKRKGKNKNVCHVNTCKKKSNTFLSCRCNYFFCIYHQYPDHECTNRFEENKKELSRKLIESKISPTHNYEKI